MRAPLLERHPLVTDQPALLGREAFRKPQIARVHRVQAAVTQAVQFAVARFQQVDIRAVTVQAGHQAILLQALVHVVEAGPLAIVRQFQAQVVNQLQRRGGLVHVGVGLAGQAQRAATHRTVTTAERLQAEMAVGQVTQAVAVGHGQPGIGEAPGQPAIGVLDQTLLGDFLHGGKQRQAQLVGRHVAGNQLEHVVLAIRALLAHQDPVIAALPVQGQAYRDAEVGQFDAEAMRVIDGDRPPAGQHLAEVERQAEALVTQPLAAGLDPQRQGLEVTGKFAEQGSRHGASLRGSGRDCGLSGWNG